jgi:hypothetical protein
MQTILGACIGLCAVFACMAQVVGITGVVTDTGNTIILGAFVKLEKTGLSDSTESDGSVGARCNKCILP